MRSFLFTVLLLFSIVSFSQRKISVPQSLSASFKQLGLDKKYSISGLLQPTTLKGDFNGDGVEDFAVSILENKSAKEGLLILHGNSKVYYVLGAGKSFASGGDNFDWADKWALYTKSTATETTFDKKSGDILASKKIKLTRTGLLIEDYEDGAALAGGIVYWDGKKYIWIHQGE